MEAPTGIRRDLTTGSCTRPGMGDLAPVVSHPDGVLDTGSGAGIHEA